MNPCAPAAGRGLYLCRRGVGPAWDVLSYGSVEQPGLLGHEGHPSA